MEGAREHSLALTKRKTFLRSSPISLDWDKDLSLFKLKYRESSHQEFQQGQHTSSYASLRLADDKGIECQ